MGITTWSVFNYSGNEKLLKKNRWNLLLFGSDDDAYLSFTDSLLFGFQDSYSLPGANTDVIDGS